MFAEYMVLYVENPEDSPKKKKRTNSAKLQDTKATCKNQLHFQALINNPKGKLRE